MHRFKNIVSIIAALVIGIVTGGYLFSCGGTCLQENELLGLLTSVGVQRFSALAPSVVKETDKTIVIEHPSPQARIHYLVIPKKDIKNVGDLSDADSAYLIDAFKTVSEIIREKNLTNYRLTTNGPEYQTMTYLHFHLTAN